MSVHTSKGFRDALRREQRLMIDEMIRGCNDCSEADDTCCSVHVVYALRLLTKPREYIKVELVKGVWKSKRIREIELPKL